VELQLDLGDFKIIQTEDLTIQTEDFLMDLLGDGDLTIKHGAMMGLKYHGNLGEV